VASLEAQLAELRGDLGDLAALGAETVELVEQQQTLTVHVDVRVGANNPA
jgi:hypothetical protein